MVTERLRPERPPRTVSEKGGFHQFILGTPHIMHRRLKARRWDLLMTTIRHSAKGEKILISSHSFKNGKGDTRCPRAKIEPVSHQRYKRYMDIKLKPGTVCLRLSRELVTKLLSHSLQASCHADRKFTGI